MYRVRLHLAAVFLLAVSLVADDIHLLMQPSEILPELVQEEFNNVTIPCLSTSSSVKVKLFKNFKLLAPNTSYDGMTISKHSSKFGFLLQNLTISNSGLYYCFATYNNSVNTAMYKLTILPSVEKVIVKKYDGKPDFITVGQNVSFECSVKMNSDVAFELCWRIKKKRETGHVYVGGLNYFNSRKIGDDKIVAREVLNINNVSIEDEGDYFCEVTVNSLLISHGVYTLQVHNPSDFYLSLSVQGGVSEIVSKAGTPELELIIEILANPEPILIWKDPYGVIVGKNPQKIHAENNKMTSKLIIKDLDLFDSGVYKLYANNHMIEKQISLSLLVESEPIVKSIFYSDPPEGIEAIYSHGCDIYGYPLPEFDWVFKGCSNNLECDDKAVVEIKSSVSKVDVTRYFLHNIKTYISFNLNGTGTLMCKASNVFGNAYENIPISED